MSKVYEDKKNVEDSEDKVDMECETNKEDKEDMRDTEGQLKRTKRANQGKKVADNVVTKLL